MQAESQSDSRTSLFVQSASLEGDILKEGNLD